MRTVGPLSAHMPVGFNTSPAVNAPQLSGDVSRCGNVCMLTINFSLDIANCASHQEVVAAQQGM